MTHDEAQEWLRGERSMCNMVPQHPFETWQERISRADAAMTEKAYWTLRAHAEGILAATHHDRADAAERLAVATVRRADSREAWVNGADAGAISEDSLVFEKAERECALADISWRAITGEVQP